MSEQKKRRISVITMVIIAIIVIGVIVGAVFLIKGIFNKSKNTKNDELAGYMCLIDSSNGVYTFVDTDGNVKSYENYIAMTDFYYNVSAVKAYINPDEYKRGYALIDNKENQIVPYGKYESIEQIETGKYYKVEAENKYGIINPKGEEIVQPAYDYIRVYKVQDETEFIFECEDENSEDAKYHYINEKGVELYTSNEMESISYYYTISNEFTTVVEIGDKYINIATGEEVFTIPENEDVKYRYNILYKRGHYTVYDKNLKVKEDVENPSISYVDVSKIGQYICVDLSIREEGSYRTTKRTVVYDNDLNKIKEYDGELIVKVDETTDEVYFVYEDEASNVVVTDKADNTILTLTDVRRPSSSTIDSCLEFTSKDGSTNKDLYDFKGNLIAKGVYGTTLKGSSKEKDYVVIKRKDATSYSESMRLSSGVEYQIDNSANIQKCNDNVMTSNWSKKAIKMYNNKGELVREIDGVISAYYDEYVRIENLENNTYEIYNINNLEMTFSCSKDDYIRDYSNIKVLKLKNGYYNLNGKLLLDRVEE